MLPAVPKYELAGSALITASSVTLSRALKQTEPWIIPCIHAECKKTYGKSICLWVCPRKNSAMKPLPVLTNTSAYMLEMYNGSQLCSSETVETDHWQRDTILVLAVWTNQDLIHQILVSLCSKKTLKRVGERRLVFLHGAHF